MWGNSGINKIGRGKCRSSTKSATQLCGAKPNAPARFTAQRPIGATDFIHFSTAAQVAETAATHFAGLRDLLLVQVDAAKLSGALKWEPSRGGDLFPHLYGPLNLSAVIRVEPLPLGPDGARQFPPLAGKATAAGTH